MASNIRKFIGDMKEVFENEQPYQPTEDDIEMLEEVLKALEEAKYQAEHQHDYGFHEIAEKVNKVLKD